jgi:asparagine synthase (glutamine-hydrolysing)
MCGIVAIVNGDQKPAGLQIVQQMSDIIAHRGPDAAGLWSHDNVAFGHRRLSIIDLSEGGKQPMHTPDGRYTIAYNGEIYNFVALRTELAALGEHFSSRSDTEVLLRAISRWGIQRAASRLNGIFALVVYDQLERKLLIARDRYGIKPLYYCNVGNVMLFASEAKAFSAHPSFSANIDPEGLVEYLTFQNFISDRTLIKNVRMFPAGHTASLNCNAPIEMKTQEYWDFRFEDESDVRSPEDMKSELLHLFQQAVSRQLISDVEVSSYLSGGMDSGSITAVAAGLLPKLRTFTCGFDLTSASGNELTFDERGPAERMSYLFDTEHYEVVLKAKDMERAFSKIVYHLDEPRVGQSYPNYYVAGLASKFGKVVLGGTGGDELFGGYPWRYYQGAGARNLREFSDQYFPVWERLIPQKQMSSVLAPIWQDVKHIDVRDMFNSVLKQHPVDFAHPSACLNLALYFEAKTFLHGLLVVEDKLSMAHGLESRVPFLDNDLVDFALKIPASAKVGNLQQAALANQSKRSGEASSPAFKKSNDGKLLLRSMMEELLPKEITEAQKQGFSAPDSSWFRKESAPFVKKQLLNADAPIFKSIDYDAVTPMLNSHFDGGDNKRLLVWSLLSVNEQMEQNLHQSDRA